MKGMTLTGDTSYVVMTYAELADKLKIKPASAKRLVQRRKWHRVIGNDGVTRVHVPPSVGTKTIIDDVTPDIPDDVIEDKSTHVTPDLSSRVAYLEGVIEGLQAQVEAERNRAIAENQRANTAEARVQDISEDREAWKRQAQRSLWSRLFGLG